MDCYEAHCKLATLSQLQKLMDKAQWISYKVEPSAFKEVKLSALKLSAFLANLVDCNGLQ